MQVVSPQLGVRVRSARLVRESMPPQIHRHEATAARQFRIHLSGPGERALRDAMDEYNWTSLGVAHFSDVQLNASSASDHMALHGASPWLARATGARAVTCGRGNSDTSNGPFSEPRSRIIRMHR